MAPQGEKYFPLLYISTRALSQGASQRFGSLSALRTDQLALPGAHAADMGVFLWLLLLLLLHEGE